MRRNRPADSARWADPVRHSSLIARHLLAERPRRRGARDWRQARLAEARAFSPAQWRRLGLCAALYAVFAAIVLGILVAPGGPGAAGEWSRRDERRGGTATGSAPTIPALVAPATPATPATAQAPRGAEAAATLGAATGAEPAAQDTPVSEVAPLVGTPQRLQASATISNPAPAATGPVTVTGTLRRGSTGVAGVPLRTVWRFRSGEAACDGPATDVAGRASCTFELVDATPGYPVVVEVIFEVEGQTYRAWVTFTPR